MYEKGLQQQIDKAKEEYSDLYQTYEKLKIASSYEEMQDLLDTIQRKMADVKDAFGSINVIKTQYIEEVRTLYCNASYGDSIVITYIGN